MPVIEMNKKLAEEHGLSFAELEEGINGLGGEVRAQGDKLFFEVPPNRWDLFVPEGIIHAVMLFHGKRKQEKVVCEDSGVRVEVEESVKAVRPFVVCAVIENIEVSGEYISQLMQVQEKLHETIGRKRRKLAIGIHDFDKVKPPFVYKAIEAEAIAFEPLGFNQKMNLREILERHPKGIEYGWILQGAQKYPIILDSNENVLSFPPIINGNLTVVTESTKNLFIDMTGTHLQTLKYALNVLTYSMLLRGGRVKSVRVHNGEEFITPDYTWKKKSLEKEEIWALLGMEIPSPASLLERMGYIAEEKGGRIEVEVPPYRCDVLHRVDLIEDIAIAYGYDNIKKSLPKVPTIGELDEMSVLEEEVRKFFVGFGAQEICSFVLGSEKTFFTNMGLRIDEAKAVRTKNAKSADYSIARPSLIPCLLNSLYVNQRHPMPLKLFEIGMVFEPEERRKCAIAIMHSKANFSEIKSIAESFLREFEVDYRIEAEELPYFVSGRCAKIIVKEKKVGAFGEVHPATLEKFGIDYPVVAFECELSALLSRQSNFNC